MMRNERKISIDFISDRHDLSWAEVELGIKEGWLFYEDAIDLAMKHVQDGNESPIEFEMASLYKTEHSEVSNVLVKLIELEQNQSFENVKIIWLRILLSWIYMHKDSFEDPISIVEELYEDFGYPNEIRNLVRYNNSLDNDSLTSEDDLVELWRIYVNNCFNETSEK